MKWSSGSQSLVSESVDQHHVETHQKSKISELIQLFESDTLGIGPGNLMHSKV